MQHLHNICAIWRAHHGMVRSRAVTDRQRITQQIMTRKRRPAHRQWLLVRLILLALVLGPLQGIAHTYAAPRAQSSSDPLVLAFYYTWFDQNTWTYNSMNDLPAEQYASADRGVMGRHIDQARAAGIDALILAWYGPGGDNQTEPNLAAMLDEANARGFKIGVLFETTSPFFGGAGDAQAALQHLNDHYANHPAFLRVDGRPVIFFWRPTIYGVETWRNIRAAVDPNYSNIWISEGVDTSYLAVFDGHHLYSNTWNPPADLNATNQKFASSVAAARNTYGTAKIWVATVMPGYDDVKVRGGFARDREGGNYFAQSWSAAIASNPSWIVINSFNEWPEGSYIEPSVNYGDLFIGLSATYSQQFKSGGGAAITFSAPAPLPPQPTPTPTPPPTEPTAYVNTALLNLRAGPNTEAEIVGQVASGLPLTISGQDPAFPEWWQVTYNDSTAWVYGPLVTTGGPMEQVQQITAAPLAQVSAATTQDGAQSPSSGPSTELSTVATPAASDSTQVATAATLNTAETDTVETTVEQSTTGQTFTEESSLSTVVQPDAAQPLETNLISTGPQIDPNYQPVQPYLAR